MPQTDQSVDLLLHVVVVQRHSEVGNAHGINSEGCAWAARCNNNIDDDDDCGGSGGLGVLVRYISALKMAAAGSSEMVF